MNNTTRPTTFTATYDRPTHAKLVVALDNGDTWEATPDDLSKFNLTPRTNVYGYVEENLADALGKNPVNSPLNSVRYLIEVACYFQHLHPTDGNRMSAIRAQIKTLDAVLNQHMHCWCGGGVEPVDEQGAPDPLGYGFVCMENVGHDWMLDQAPEGGDAVGGGVDVSGSAA